MQILGDKYELQAQRKSDVFFPAFTELKQTVYDYSTSAEKEHHDLIQKYPNLQGTKLYRATKSELIEQNSNLKKHLTMTLRNTKRIINYCVLIIERLTDKFIGRSDYSPVAYGFLPKPGETGGNYDPHVKGKNVSAFIVHSVTH